MLFMNLSNGDDFERQAICFIIPYVAVCKLQENNTVDENDMYTVKFCFLFPFFFLGE